MENKFIRVDEVADELGVSRPYGRTPILSARSMPPSAVCSEARLPSWRFWFPATD